MTNRIELDPRLRSDTHRLGQLGSCDLLLMQNALFPWFILVPPTNEIEFYKVERELQLDILQQINALSDFIQHQFNSDKINIGSIGNIVSQLHIHVVGRFKTDCRWPDVVWGVKENMRYTSEQVSIIQQQLHKQLPGSFSISND